MCKRPSISVIHPSFKRLDMFRRTYSLWMGTSEYPEAIEYILVVEDRDPDMFKYLESFTSLLGNKAKYVAGDFRCIVASVNRGCEHATGEIIMFVGDDHLPCPHWDTKIREALEGKEQAMLWVDEGADNDFITMPIMTRARYEHEGFMCYPEYKSMCADLDYTRCAELDGVIVKAKHIKLLHDHKGQESDETYRHTASEEFSRIGREVYEKRKENNFGRPRR